jgi:hypothetical protein
MVILTKEYFSMSEDETTEMLGVWIAKSDKKIIKELARRNRMSISTITRILLNNGLENLNTQNILKLV